MVNFNNYSNIHLPSINFGRQNITNRYETNARFNSIIGSSLGNYGSYLPNISTPYYRQGGYGLNMNASWRMGGFGMPGFGLGPPGMYGMCPGHERGNSSVNGWGLGLGIGSAMLIGFAEPIGNFIKGLIGRKS